MPTTTCNKIPVIFPGHLLLIFLFVLFTGNAAAQKTWFKSNCPRSQKQAELWYFGEKAGIDFRSGTAIPLLDEDVMTAFKASASICDSVGNLIMFTDGRRVWDRSFSLMPNATGLAGDLGATQPCVIVPWPGDSSLYYIFTVDILKFQDSITFTTQGLSNTVIDLKLRNGLGDATSSILNAPLLSPVSQKLTAVKHKNDKYFWVIVHEWNSDKFYAYLVNYSGIAAPVISAVGSIHGGNSKDANNAVGYLKASPDGSRLALAITEKKVIEVFDFDNETGVVSNAQSYTTTRPGVNPYGVEFSPDCRFLYATLFEIGGVVTPSRPSFIYQFDLKNGLTNPAIIDSIAGLRIAAMQLAPDGRIYLSRTNNILSKRDSLEVIYNPNRPGKACNFNMLNNVANSNFSLLGRKSIYSLPNFVQSYLNVPPFTWDSVCEGDITRFQITNIANIDSVTWDFGDGGTSNQMDPLHEFTSPGTYLVKLTEKFNGQNFTDSISVINYPKPVISLGDTVLLYSGSTINLHAGGGFTEYLWSNGSRDSVINVRNQGSYWAKVKDIHCCINADTTFVKVFEYFIPNAFSPNGDGINDVFRVNGLYKNIKFSMIVYDRWGQLVFKSENVDKVWDGTYKGQICPPETYVWIVNIGFLGQDIITNGDIVFKGTVTIIR
ncbi:MAG: gliding motility-associated C-terminal domain-containing protein [Bacteroidales bacterium]|nr:gliding motility-associated C-terminal domain-containing protein [Bacteroidales bacterium]